ncbi:MULTISPECIES: hypothetical protein [Nocardioides]|uniref:Asp23/Gls24 family envelope stress response protein n=1 Tax=Nocardioides kribbensis TaxID=305517 RepID=A0ABV1NUK7_9ACTN|nr:hypothetical protein [Nocardioides sp. P86]MCM3515229.1 hypothetical protein [Nocardioides sp. P86]
MAVEPQRDDGDDLVGADRPDVAGGELLDRALRAVREDDPGGFEGVRSSVLERVRRTVVPADPVLVRRADGGVDHDPDGSRTWVSSRVVRSAVRRLAQRRVASAPASVQVDVDEERVTRVRLGLVCSYGTDVRSEAAEVRGEVQELLVSLVGPDPRGAVDVDIDVVDVVEGDPRLV